MANIVITYKCNLKCPYCFANEFVNKNKDDMSLENFIKIVEFIKKTPNERIGIIGGEPLTHKLFPDFINIINKDKKIKKAILYSNGILLDKYIDVLKNKKFKILINCNSPDDIGDVQYNQLKNNLSLLNKKKDKKLIYLGINLYSKEKDYKYIFELLKMLKQNKIRISLTVPNFKQYDKTDALDLFKEYKSIIFNFIKTCYEINVIPFYDCNTIPDCIWDEEEFNLFCEIERIARKNGEYYNLTKNMKPCRPVIDILPSLEAIRCFGFSSFEKVPISNFNNVQAIRNFFFYKYDIFSYMLTSSKNCKSCDKINLNECSCGCLVYKAPKVENLKSMIKSLN